MAYQLKEYFKMDKESINDILPMKTDLDKLTPEDITYIRDMYEYYLKGMKGVDRLDLIEQKQSKHDIDLCRLRILKWLCQLQGKELTPDFIYSLLTGRNSYRLLVAHTTERI